MDFPNYNAVLARGLPENREARFIGSNKATACRRTFIDGIGYQSFGR
jgi:hypothetical protein